MLRPKWELIDDMCQNRDGDIAFLDLNQAATLFFCGKWKKDALEVYRVTGTPISDFQNAHGFSDQPYRVLKIGLDMAGIKE